jgi:intracellular multiplication protein IcmP
MAAGQQGQGSDDQTLYVFWAILAIIVTAMLLWYVEKQLIVHVVFAIRTAEIAVILPFMKAVAYVASLVHLPQPDLSILYKAKLFMATFNLSTITWSHLEELNVIVGNYFRWITISIAACGAVYLFRYHRLARYVHIYTMKSFRKLEVQNWPQITPIISTDLIKAPLTKGVWASARTPLDFCKDHNLLSKPTEENDIAWHVNKQQSMRYFMIQMGPLMPKKITYLPIYIQALLAIFILRALGKDKVALDLVYQISRSAGSGKLDFTGVSEHIQEHKDSRLIEWLYQRHSYVTTFMARALESARTTGVLASSDFLWLKPLDRRMWYMLNSIGRQTCVVESAGPFAHFISEKRFDRPLKTPMINKACDALEVCIRDIKYVDEGDSWRSKGG